MTRNDIIKILALLSQNYESFSKKLETDEQVENVIYLWQECLGDLDFNVVSQAVKKAIIDSPYPPTIHDIRKNAIEFINPTNDDPLKDWDEAYKMIKNGSYMTQEEFDQHSPICRKFFGSVSQLKAYSTNTEFNLDVTRANFLKQHENIIKRDKEEKLIPDKMKDIVQKLASNFEIKQLEGGKNGGE